MKNNALVTEGIAGFGEEIALTLARSGFRVYAGTPDADSARRVSNEADKQGVDIRGVALDVTEGITVTRAIERIVAEGNGIHTVVHNATTLLRGFFEDLTQREIRAVFETNLFGTMSVTRAALPHMRAAGKGRVVVISSVAGRFGAPTGSAYSASRFAQGGFAESLRQELEPLGIYVSLVEPGITRTDSWTVDKCAGERTGDIRSPYYTWFKRSESLFDQAMCSSGLTSADVAAAVLRAVTDTPPRWRYMIGRRAKLITALRRYVPGELFERFYFREVVRRLTNPRT